jgi:type IV pilus assembly protein PilC
MSLLRTADQLEKDASLRRQVRSAMIYPTLIISFALLVMLALVAFLIPVFQNVFKQFGGKLPTLTQFMVNFSALIRHQGYIVFGVVVALVVAFIKWKKSKTGRAQWDAFKLRIPLKIGDVVQKVAIARWSRTFSSLTAAGVPVMQALDITGKTAGNAVIEASMAKMVAHMVGVGEETGAVDAMLSKIADFYEDEVAAAVKALTSILEPAMIIFVGGIVGVIVISMYLPLFNVYNQIH